LERALRIEKNWGFEQIIHNSGYCLKLLVYERPIRSSYHYHERKHECFFVHSGLFEIEINDSEPRTLLPSDRVILPPLMKHRIRCLEPGTIVEASSFDDPDDCVRIIPSDA
jgi:mannose-6-phosphate isomerase-like protein (cupin superfamily)